MKEMYWIFVILGILLLAFNLEPVTGRPRHGHYAVIWTWHHFSLLRIVPYNWYVLIDRDTPYLYTDPESNATYVTAVRLDTKREYHLLHFRFLLDWIQEPAVVQAYEPTLSHVIDILNDLSLRLKV